MCKRVKVLLIISILVVAYLLIEYKKTVRAQIELLNNQTIERTTIVETIKQGEIKLLKYVYDQNIAHFKCNNRDVKHTNKNGLISFIISASYTTSQFDCRINGEIVYKINVLPTSFEQIHLDVPKQYTQIKEKDLIRIRNEKKILSNVYSASPSKF